MKGKDSVTAVSGIGPKKAQLLLNLGIRTVEDLYLHYPRDYEDRREITPVCQMSEERKILVRARVRNVRSSGYGRNQNVYLICEDNTGSFEALFFHAGFIKNTVKTGMEYDFYGYADLKRSVPRMIHPEFAPANDENRGIIPIYPLTKGISNNEMRKWQKRLLDEADYEEYLPDKILERNNLCSLPYALSNVHFPEERQKLAESKYRIVFDELLTMQLGIMLMKSRYAGKTGGIMFSPSVDEGDYIDTMPYQLTRAQRKAVQEIIEDMESPAVMNRLLQGDVGSGKTAVAEIALFKAVKSGYQAVLMAPTEILAVQHFEGISKAFSAFGIKVSFLGGKMKAAERRDTLAGIEDGSVDVVIGTHAVISETVHFRKLGLVITDEQHRFGVNQRTLLGNKGEHPDRLVMTATPIPRTLAVVLYGDLDVSIIDELPAGRLPVKTKALDGKKRKDAYDIVREELEKGHQGYVVTPLIDENEDLDILSVNEVYAELKDKFSEYSVAMLHGEMKSSEKDEIMAEFYAGNIHLLVSTVVIEVGINVPNATVMVIENAERFGLAQLHQLRGRVGRGKAQAQCLLITEGKSEVARERAAIMEKSNDGFFIAEEDLKLRGPGEIFGTRQHGLPDLRMADLVRHVKVLKAAGEEAKRIANEDPFLESDEYAPLMEKITNIFGEDITFNL